MDRSKMSAIDEDYGDDIHQVLDDIPEPNDDSMTISSFENSQMTYSKSFTQSKIRKQKNKHNEGRRNEYGNDPNVDKSLNDHGDGTLTVNSIESSPGDKYSRSRVDHKHSNSPALNDTLDLDQSHDPNNFESKNLRQDGGEYDNYKSIRYGDNTLGDGTLDGNDSPNFRQQLHLTETSRYQDGSNITDFVGRGMQNDDSYQDESGEYEYEESEEEDSQLNYVRRTDGSTEENYSLADHTRSQYIENKELTGVMLHKQSLGEQTNDRNNFTNSLDQHSDEGEGEYEEEESDFNIDSQISGYDSLSQTHKSKVSSKGFKKSGRFNRNSKSRRTGNFAQPQTMSSQYNESDSIYKHPDGSDSI